MIRTILGTKKEMSVRFDGLGQRIPVTIIQADPNVVVLQKEGKVLLGLGKKRKVKKTENAFVSAVGFVPRFVREVKIKSSESTDDKGSQVATDGKISVSIFEPGDEVKVTGITRGKGFTGVVKRWGFAGGPKTHGQSDRHRAPGSIGQTTRPGRVYRGKRMAGHAGSQKLTVRGLKVVEVDPAHHLLIIKGAVPGSTNSLVIVEKTGKVASHISPMREGEPFSGSPDLKNEERTKSAADTGDVQGTDN